MADIVLGFASSHGPTMHNPSEEWSRITEHDMQDPRWDFAAAARNPRPGIEQEIQPEKKQARFEACQAGIKSLQSVVSEARPDVVVVVSNPHGVSGNYSMQPVLGVYLSAARSRIARSGHQARFSNATPLGDGEVGPGTQECLADSELADHLFESLLDDGFDPSCCYYPDDRVAVDHAFTSLIEYAGEEVPMVPVVLSRYLPNQASPARCYELGRAMRRSIEGWKSNKRVAVMASGGLSHQLVDEDLDRMVVDGLLEKDRERLSSLPRDRLNRAPGTPEILNWVTLAGAMESTDMTLVDYVPCYQSLAGSGQGVTFAYWK